MSITLFFTQPSCFVSGLISGQNLLLSEKPTIASRASLEPLPRFAVCQDE